MHLFVNAVPQRPKYTADYVADDRSGDGKNRRRARIERAYDIDRFDKVHPE